MHLQKRTHTQTRKQHTNEVMSVDGFFDSFMWQRFAQNWNNAFELNYCCRRCCRHCARLYTQIHCLYCFLVSPEFISFRVHLVANFHVTGDQCVWLFYIRRTYRSLLLLYSAHTSAKLTDQRKRFFFHFFFSSHTETSWKHSIGSDSASYDKIDFFSSLSLSPIEILSV